MKTRNLSRIFSTFTAALMLFAFTSSVVGGDKKMSHKVKQPSDIKAEKTDDNNVKLSWNSVSDADQYKIYRAELTQNELKQHHKGKDKARTTEMDETKKAGEHKMYSSIKLEDIDRSKLNFREIGTTTNSEFVDRTVETALRTHTRAGSEQYAMGEADRGPSPEERTGERAGMNDVVFLYSIAAVDDEGNESMMSDLTQVDFDETSKTTKEYKKDKDEEEKNW